MKLITLLALLVPAFAISQTVSINEVVTDPQQDWSDDWFLGTPGIGTPDTGDEWIEIYIGTAGLDLSLWTIELNDGTDISGNLSNVGAFTTSNYFTSGSGLFTNTEVGDYLILGGPSGGDMDDDITIILRDGTTAIIDQVIIGSGGTVFDGNSSAIGDESVCRIPNGQDTGVDADDFVKTRATLGTNNSPTGIVLINEVVVDPQQDWSGGGFNGAVGMDTPSETDEWIELYIGTSGLNLLKWNIDVNDGASFSGDLTSRDVTGTGAFQTIFYFGAGTFENTVAGDYLILGNPQSSEDIGLEVTVTLTDADGTTIDAVVIASASGTMVNGNATGVSDESVCRIPNGTDTDVDASDFVKTRATMGTNNSPSGIILINEVVTTPRVDWDTNGFDGTDGLGTISEVDEWIELYIGTSGLNLTSWTLSITDSDGTFFGDLSNTGVFDVSNYIGSGSFTNTVAGDYLILGDPDGSNDMKTDVYITLSHPDGALIDDVEIGDDYEGDGGGDGTITSFGAAIENESIARIANANDSDVDVDDFRDVVATLGAENGLMTVYVDDDAADDTGLGTMADPLQTIQAAVDLALTGGTVIVAGGTYAESVSVIKALTIEGPNVGVVASGSRVAEAIIDPVSSGNGITVSADNVAIDGFQFGASNVSSNVAVGIISNTANTLDFSNNIIYANTIGISTNDISSGTLSILDNDIEMISLVDVNTGNTGSIGVSLQEVTGTVDANITNNNITGASWGLFGYGLSATPEVVIDGGAYSGCTQGVSVLNVNSIAEFSPSTYTIQNVTMSGFVDPGAGISQPDAQAGIYAFVTGNATATDDIVVNIDNVDISGIGNTSTDYAAIYIADFQATGPFLGTDDDGIGIDATISNSNIHDNLNRGIHTRGRNAISTITNSIISGNGSNPNPGAGAGVNVYAQGTAIVENSFLTNPVSGTASLLVSQQQGTITATNNSFDNNGNGSGLLADIQSGTTGSIDMSGNWFGSNDEATIDALIDYDPAEIDFTPWFDLGTDLDLGTAGFQPDTTVLRVGLSGAQTSAEDRIQEAHDLYDLVLDIDTIIVGTGTYNELFTANTNVVLEPAASVTLDNIEVDAAGDTLAINGDILINTSVVLTNGIINSAGTMTLGSAISDLPSETTANHVIGTVSTGARLVDFGSLNMLGVNIAVDADPDPADDLDNVIIVRNTGPAGIITDGYTSIAVNWDITADAEPTTDGRDITFSWIPEFLNGKDLSSATLYRNSVGTWEKMITGYDATGGSYPITNVTGFSVWTIGQDDQPLPVELISFSATPDNGRVMLSWETASELNNDRFEVECSKDGESFNQIGTVGGKGTTSSQNSYSFVDQEPMSGINYYRLKQVDFDGASEYSKIIWINPYESSDVQVYPNPAQNVVKIVGNGLFTEKNKVRILNIEGKEMDIFTPSMSTQELKIDLKTYPVGIYIIEIATPDKVYLHKFIKD